MGMTRFARNPGRADMPGNWRSPQAPPQRRVSPLGWAMSRGVWHGVLQPTRASDAPPRNSLRRHHRPAKHRTSYHLAHQLLDYAQHLQELGDNDGAGAAASETHEIAAQCAAVGGSERCRPARIRPRLPLFRLRPSMRTTGSAVGEGHWRRSAGYWGVDAVSWPSLRLLHLRAARGLDVRRGASVRQRPSG